MDTIESERSASQSTKKSRFKMKGVRDSEYRDSGWHFSFRIHRSLVRAPLQTADELLQSFSASYRPSPPFFYVDEFRYEPLAAAHVRSVLENELRGAVECKDGRWCATSQQFLVPPLWLESPLSWSIQSGQGGSDSWLRFIRYLHELPPERLVSYARRFPEPPHWRTFYSFALRKRHDLSDRLKGIDVYARREFQAAVRADARGDTYFSCRHLARILEHCGAHPLFLAAMDMYERLRELHEDVKSSRFDRIEFHREKATRQSFAARAIAAACDPPDEDEFVQLPVSARRLVRICQACPNGESVSWTVWKLENDSGNLIGVRKSWDSWKDRARIGAPDANPTVFRQQVELPPHRTRSLLRQLAASRVSSWSATPELMFDPYRQFAVELDGSRVAWSGTAPTPWSAFVDAAQALRAHIDASLTIWLHEESGQSFYLALPNCGPHGIDVEELVCGCVDDAATVYARPVDPMPAVTCIPPGRLQHRQLNWLIVNEALVDTSGTIPIDQVVTKHLTNRIVPLDWKRWTRGDNEDWVTDRLGMPPREYLLDADADRKATSEASLRHLALPPGPRLRVESTPALNDVHGNQWYMPMGAWDRRNHVFAAEQFVVATAIGREWLETVAPKCFNYDQLRLEQSERG